MPFSENLIRFLLYTRKLQSNHLVFNLCPSGWKQHNSSCYKFFSSPQNWTDAKSTCTGFGGNLVIIDSAEENSFVKDLIWPAYKKSWGGVWFGASDQEKEGAWKWMDGQDMKYTAFHWGQPDNCCGGQNCGQFLYWNQPSWASLAWDDVG